MEQLGLFKTMRARKRPSPKEFALQCVLADILRRWISPSWKFTAIPLGEYRTPATAARLKRAGANPGWPDLLFTGPGRSVFWLELKRPGSGRLSDEQIAIRAHLMRCGFSYLVTSSIKDAVSELQDFGILPRGINVQ